MHSTLRRKLLWLIAGRAALITLLLGTAILIQRTSPGVFGSDQFFPLIGLTYALTAVYSVGMQLTLRHRWLVDVQLACDAFIVSALVGLTGGVASYFSSLYALPIIAASTIQSRRGGLLVGVLSSLLYAGVVASQYGGPFWHAVALPALPELRVALFTAGLNIFGFMAVASLSGHLAEGLREAGEKLEHASNQIEDLQAFGQHVIDSLRSGLMTTDVGGRILTFNRTAEAITGVPGASAVGAPATDVLQLPSEFAQLFGQAEGRPRLPRVEFTFRKQDGTDIELGVSTATLVTPRGETGFVVTFQDVTEARRQDREALVQQRLAAVGEMAAGIAHEIRNPLASMSGSIQILRQELPLTPDQSQLMDIVLRESERLNDTIRSFLAYAKPKREVATRVDIGQVITDTARLLQHNAELTDAHQIIVELPPDAVCYEADENQIRQVVWNLATNGVRAMPSGGCLRLSAARHEAGATRRGELVIAVHDEGVGIPAQELDGIFQPFRGTFARGSGLGLSIVHRIVSDCGGEIRVTSRESEGTTVTVALPLQAAAHAVPA